MPQPTSLIDILTYISRIFQKHKITNALPISSQMNDVYWYNQIKRTPLGDAIADINQWVFATSPKHYVEEGTYGTQDKTLSTTSGLSQFIRDHKDDKDLLKNPSTRIQALRLLVEQINATWDREFALLEKSIILPKQQLREMISKLPDDEIKSQEFTPIRFSFSALESEELDDSSDTSLPFTPPSARSEYLKLNNQLHSLEAILKEMAYLHHDEKYKHLVMDVFYLMRNEGLTLESAINWTIRTSVTYTTKQGIIDAFKQIIPEEFKTIQQLFVPAYPPSQEHLNLQTALDDTHTCQEASTSLHAAPATSSSHTESDISEQINIKYVIIQINRILTHLNQNQKHHNDDWKPWDVETIKAYSHIRWHHQLGRAFYCTDPLGRAIHEINEQLFSSTYDDYRLGGLSAFVRKHADEILTYAPDTPLAALVSIVQNINMTWDNERARLTAMAMPTTQHTHLALKALQTKLHRTQPVPFLNEARGVINDMLATPGLTLDNAITWLIHVSGNHQLTAEQIITALEQAAPKEFAVVKPLLAISVSTEIDTQTVGSSNQEEPTGPLTTITQGSALFAPSAMTTQRASGKAIITPSKEAGSSEPPMP